MEIDLQLEEFDVQCSIEGCSYIANEGQVERNNSIPRTIKVWKLSSDKVLDTGKPVVISSGFGRSMDQMGSLAANLAANGVPVYRYDSLDHAGMSDGNMVDFTLSTGLASLEAVIDWVAQRHGGSDVGLVSTSLTARIAYRLVSTSTSIAFLVTAVGVVHIRKTLLSVMGEDYSSYREEELPATVDFERQPIGTIGFYTDFFKNNWLNKEETIEELRTINVPISAFIANGDEWIDRSEIEEVIDPSAHSNRTVFIMEDCEHNFGKNLRSAEYFLISVTDIVCGYTLPDRDEERIQVGFEQILNQSIKERRIQRSYTKKSRAKERAHRNSIEEICES
ncbi:hypothetical protein A9Q99_25350 [Gammaproteobacteria bacterium 45_16_T64]|nr:hypothetical protein A9Q99_25350 [Gammaproteobacteria bacterium 45_16_T64]